jgi:RHS repeat-associated protein
MQSPGSQGTRYASTPEIDGVFSLAADPQLAENSRQGSERKNRTLAPGFATLKSQTTQWGSWQISGRTAAAPTVYLYDGPNDLIEEIDNSGNVLAKYTQTTNIDEPLSELRSGATSYYEQDGIDAVTSLTNPTGTVANSYTFDSYGKLTASTGTLANPFQYTGRELDGETGLYYYRARYYDSNTGRFISADPLEFGGGVNFYSYALNSPVNLRDPRGKSAGAIAVPVSEGIGTLVCFGSGVCETVIVVGGVVVGVAATGYLIWELVKPCDKTNTTRCAPCIPPAGTIAYRLDVVPPSRVHKPYPGTHWHLYRMNQNPNNCQCFWQDLDQDGDGPTPPGAVPITPAAGGGPQ